MMTELTLLGLCGSLRAASLNRRLMREGAARFAGTFAEADVRLPLYDGDLEDQGVPPEVRALCAAIDAADAVLIACPEYNKAPSGVLKNALDWISRVKPNPLAGKPVAIVSATGGRAGGERAQTMLRAMLVPHRAETLGWPEVLVGEAEGQFDAEGRLTNTRNAAALDQLMIRLREAVSG
jgi:chromate reductase